MRNLDLFDYANETQKKKASPLADRLRPKDLNDLIGQKHLVGDGKVLRRMIEADRLTSILLFGPAGTGKTTIARIVANMTDAEFRKINAVTGGIQDIRKVIKDAEENKKFYSKKTICFIDEIHRFNKSQQDSLLPFVENGTIILIGATTENPYFSINNALLSRMMVFRVNVLTPDQLKDVLKRALKDDEDGLGSYNVELKEEALEHIVKFSLGDARKALNALELAVLTTMPNDEGIRSIDLETVEESIQRPAVSYDKSGDNHYDVISAFIKSMRGSDPDATVYYLALMIEAGEDPLFIARRILIQASEDVGLADSNALVVAQNAYQAVERLGMPEARIILSHAALYLALAPKNNQAYRSIDRALASIRQGEIYPVPDHLKDAHYKGSRQMGHGVGYKYPHDYPGNFVEQDYLPEKLRNKKYFI